MSAVIACTEKSPRPFGTRGLSVIGATPGVKLITVATAEDWVAPRAGTAAVIAVTTPTIIATVIVARAVVVVAALATDVAILFTLVAANLTPLFARERTVRTIAAPLGAYLLLAFAYLTSLVTRDLAGADAAPDALTVLTVVRADAAIVTLRKHLGRACQKQCDGTQEKKLFHCSILSLLLCDERSSMHSPGEAEDVSMTDPASVSVRCGLSSMKH